MDYEELIDLLLDSVQIIGIFLAIVVGLVVSKILNMKTEQNELKDNIEDINKELEIYNVRLSKKKEENLNYYKESVIYDLIDCIFENKQIKYTNDTPYISIEEKQDFTEWVKKYINEIVREILDKNNNPDNTKIIISKEEIKKKKNIKPDSLEEIIIDELYFKAGVR